MSRITRLSAIYGFASSSSNYTLSNVLNSPTGTMDSGLTLVNNSVHFREDDAGSIINSVIEDPLDHEERCGSPSQFQLKFQADKKTKAEKIEKARQARLEKVCWAGLNKKEKIKETAGKWRRKTGLRKDKKTNTATLARVDSYATATSERSPFCTFNSILSANIGSINNVPSTNGDSINSVSSAGLFQDSYSLQILRELTIVEVITTTGTTISSLSTRGMDAGQIQHMRARATTTTITSAVNTIIPKPNKKSKFKKLAKKMGAAIKEKIQQAQASKLYQ